MFSVRTTARKTLAKLEGPLTAAQVDEYRRQFLELIARNKPIELDLSGVDEVDGAGAQLLIIARLEADRRAQPCIIRASSPEVEKVFSLCGFSRVFSDGAAAEIGERIA